MGLVIDTSALIDLERRGADWETALAPFADEPVVLPAIVYAELLVGAALAGNARQAARRRARIEALARAVSVTAFDAEMASIWADLFAQLSRRGTPIPSNDLAVAATARLLGFGVLVGRKDERHFLVVPSLKVHCLV